MAGNTCFLCKSTWNHTLSMFSMPSNECLKREWDEACGTKLPRNARLCAKHFAAEDFTTSAQGRTRLLPDAVPSLNLNITTDKTNEFAINMADNYKKNRATMDQLLHYVNFARKHPTMLTAKFRTVGYLWEELAEALNAMNGVQRTPDKWKETMATWRSQLRCRARQGISSGVPEFDEFAFATFGQEAAKRQFLEGETQEANDNLPIKKGKFADSQHASNEITDNLSKQGNSEIELNAGREESTAVSATDAVVEIKTEITSDDDDKFHILKHIAEYDSDVEITLEPETDIDIKTEIDIDDNENSSSKQDHAVKTMNLPTLGFTSDNPAGSFPPRNAASTETTTATQDTSELSRSQRVSVDTDAESEPSFIVRPTKKSRRNANAPEVFIIKEIGQAASKPAPKPAPKPEPQPRKKNLTKKREDTLHKMYDTVLKSIQRREERSDGVMDVLKSLTAAVTQLANSVKRLEERLTFYTNDQ